jgi:transposase
MPPALKSWSRICTIYCSRLPGASPDHDDDSGQSAKRGFVLLPRRRVVERSFDWAARFRRLARDYEGLSVSLAGHHHFSFAWLILAQLLELPNRSS